MNIQESTRQMIIDELLMIGCVTGQMGCAIIHGDEFSCLE